jgi:hypothetical protein
MGCSCLPPNLLSTANSLKITLEPSILPSLQRCALALAISIIKYHHFREWVKSGLIDILAIDTEEQPADLLTKPLSVASFVKHRKRVMGW